MSGCGGDAGPGGQVGGELVEDVEGCGELGGCVGPVGCHERPQEVVVDLGVEVGEQQAVAGEGVAVAPGDAPDEAVAGEAGGGGGWLGPDGGAGGGGGRWGGAGGVWGAGGP